MDEKKQTALAKALSCVTSEHIDRFQKLVLEDPVLLEQARAILDAMLKHGTSERTEAQDLLAAYEQAQAGVVVTAGNEEQEDA